MNAPRSIPPYVIEHQLRASDPDVSAWVAANAGSGKTHVLTQRVISLLLKGEDPAKILCITFTKAAAANMASRIFRDLAAWISLDDAGLDRRLVEIGQKPGLATRTRARRLFALALETPGGLKVQTIHAFCTRLLHQFPFEADVAARFTVLDEASEHQLLEKLILETMLEGAANRDSALGQALAVAIAQAADQTLLEVIRDAIRQRDLILGWVDGVGSVDAAIGQLSQALGVAMDDTVEKICAECDAEGVPAREWNDLCTLFSSGKSFDLHQAERWKRAAEAGWPDAIDPYLSVFLRDDDGTPKKDQYVMGKDLRLAHPALWERLAAERERAVYCAARPADARVCHHRAISHGEKPPRPARLRRSDRQDAGAVPQDVRGLGAVQARPRRQSHPDRRSPGHQPEAMGDHPHAGERIHRRRRRAARRTHAVRRRRRQAVDLFLPGRSAGEILGHATPVRTRIPRSRA
jgi:ATP-dependent helicase/nuclease subunit A